MGASCPLSGEGLVGNHAYSILEVRELIDFNVGRQKTLHEYFNPEIGNAIIAKENFEKGRNECLRLLKIRNPW